MVFVVTSGREVIHMPAQRAIGRLLLTGALLWGTVSAGHAFDLDGGWASNPEACSKIFVKKSNAISFADDADMHGTGLIFDKNRVRGKIVNCGIKSEKQDGDVRHLLLSCSTDVAFE